MWTLIWFLADENKLNGTNWKYWNSVWILEIFHPGTIQVCLSPQYKSNVLSLEMKCLLTKQNTKLILKTLFHRGNSRYRRPEIQNDPRSVFKYMQVNIWTIDKKSMRTAYCLLFTDAWLSYLGQVKSGRSKVTRVYGHTIGLKLDDL